MYVDGQQQRLRLECGQVFFKNFLIISSGLTVIISLINEKKIILCHLTAVFTNS